MTIDKQFRELSVYEKGILLTFAIQLHQDGEELLQHAEKMAEIDIEEDESDDEEMETQIPIDKLFELFPEWMEFDTNQIVENFMKKKNTFSKLFESDGAYLTLKDRNKFHQLFDFKPSSKENYQAILTLKQTGETVSRVILLESE